MNFPSKKTLVWLLYGSRNVIASVALPCHLQSFFDNLTVSHYANVDEYINQHTLLPFYQPFLPIERLQKVREDMKGPGGRAIYLRIGIMASRIEQPVFLRSCSQCAAEDRKEVGECYWRRVHQLPIIDVCPKHGLFLNDSTAYAQNAPTRYQYFTAERSICEDLSPKYVDPADSLDQLKLLLAQDAQWLLSTPNLICGPTQLRKLYLNLLYDRGLAAFSGRLKAADFVSEFIRHYTNEILEEFGCKLDPQVEDNWLLRLVRSGNDAISPICHLLLIHFLGFTAASFFSLTPNIQPFGAGPWVCLNQTCPDFKLPVIKTCEITYRKSGRGAPTGTFRCACGFIYARVGPDRNQGDMIRIGKIVEFGDLWYQTLKESWGKSSIRALGLKLGVDSATINFQARRLGLQPCTDHSSTASPRVRDDQGMTDKDVLMSYHRRWLDLLARNPGSGITILRNYEHGLYAWLYRNDKSWLMQHSPQTLRQKRPSQRVDWNARDVEITQKIANAANKLKCSDHKPKWITRTALIREARVSGLIEQHGILLPSSTAMLQELVESRVEFAIRRIHWWASKAYSEGTQLREWELIRLAGVDRLKSLPSIRAAVQKELSKKDNIL